MDLSAPVRFEGVERDIAGYCSTLAGEQESSLAWLVEPGVLWGVPDSLRGKVEDDGRLRPFFGDTVVVPFGGEAARTIAGWQERLRGELPEVFAEPLAPESFHVTVHDLAAGPSLEALAESMEENRARCGVIFRKLAGHFAAHPGSAEAALRATRLYPSCRVSVVLGLVPASEEELRIVMGVHGLFDEVVRLGYGLRPHVTLLYFRPRPLEAGEMAKLHRALTAIDVSGLTVRLDLRRISYRRFADMSRYHELLSLSALR